LYICSIGSLSHHRTKGIICPCNEIDVRAYGFTGAFLFTKVYWFT